MRNALMMKLVLCFWHSRFLPIVFVERRELPINEVVNENNGVCKSLYDFQAVCWVRPKA